MGIRLNHYIMRGVLCPFGPFRELNEDLEDDLYRYSDTTYSGVRHHDGICILFDGMGGKYVAIGRVMAKTENGEGFGSPMKIDGKAIDDEIEMLSKINEILAKVGQGPLSELSTLVISHYR